VRGLFDTVSKNVLHICVRKFSVVALRKLGEVRGWVFEFRGNGTISL
jgi:hypothetical protein